MTYTHKPLPLSTVDKLDKPKTRGYAVDRREILDAERLGSLSSLSMCRQGVRRLDDVTTGMGWGIKVLPAPEPYAGLKERENALVNMFLTV